MNPSANPAVPPTEILIVEDSPTQAQRLEHILQQHGYQVTTAANGRLALEAARRCKPKLIISDVLMPEMDGYELCRQVKSDASLADIPLILVTTLSDPQDVIRGLECRADNFILKPYDELYLLNRVRFLFANQEVHQAEQAGMGVEIFFNGQKHFITADRLQILNLLLSTYEAAMQRNLELRRVQEELRQLNARLEAANKELESFSYSVSHDLRAPLRHVQGYVEMLGRATEGQLSEKPRHYLKTITAASVEMGQLIDDLLAFSRMGKVELHESGVSLAELVRETVKGLETETQGRNIAWKIAPLPAVQGDPVMLRQVLANVIGNAVKYTRRRDLAQIEIGSAGEEDGRIIFFVRDNGAGFNMQYAHKLFGVFQRLHRADEFEGTGIGLAIVRRVIVRHGGRVWAEGKIDEGATFYFTLKLTSPSVEASK